MLSIPTQLTTCRALPFLRLCFRSVLFLVCFRALPLSESDSTCGGRSATLTYTYSTQVISRTLRYVSCKPYVRYAMSLSSSAMTLSSSTSQGVAPKSGKWESAMPKKANYPRSNASSAGGSGGGAEYLHEAIKRFD